MNHIRTLFLALVFVVLSVPSVMAQVPTVRVASAVAPRNFADPLMFDAANSIIPSIFDGLTSIGRNGALEPALATDWMPLSDTRWRIKLREGVVFSDNSTFDADDVVYSLLLIANTDDATVGVKREADTIDKVIAIDPLTVEIETSEPDGLLMRKLARLKIIPSEALDKVTRLEFAMSPVGTGSFQVEGWRKSGRSVDLIAVPSSWRRSAQIERVIIDTFPDAVTRLQAILSDSVDIAAGIDPDAIEVLEADGFRVIVEPEPINMAVALRVADGSNPALKDQRVRHALNYAIDKKSISNNLLGGKLRVAEQIATAGLIGHLVDVDPYSYDPIRARALMADAGYPQGFDLKIAVAPGQVPGDSLVYQVMSQDLAAVGVNVELRPIIMSDLMRRQASGDWGDIDAFSTGLSNYYLGDVSRTIENASCLNPMPWFCDPELTKRIIDSGRLVDENQRRESLESIMQEMHELAPTILLVQYSSVFAVAPTVKSFAATTDQIYFHRMNVELN